MIVTHILLQLVRRDVSKILKEEINENVRDEGFSVLMESSRKLGIPSFSSGTEGSSSWQ